MKGKKDKNVSVQMNLYSIFEQVAKIEHISQYRDYPQILADQIDDIKTLLNFAASNYTNKARTILNLTKDFNKSIGITLDGVNQLDAPLYKMPQSSYPELAYETLKRSTTLELQQENDQLDWRAVHTQYQLKFMQSKNICKILEWQKCYNSQQRCIQISKISNQNLSHNSRQSLQRPLQIDLGLKIEGQKIVWHIKKVLYHSNLHYGLLAYYQNELMTWLREHYNNNIEESEKHVLNLLYNSIDYVDVILLFIELKNMPFNKNPESLDQKNGILNLFDEKETLKFTYLKGKNIKVCFMLPYSISPPSMIIRVDGLNVLKIQFTSQGEIHFKVKLKHKEQEMTIKKLIGSIKKKKVLLNSLFEIVHQVIQGLETYEGFVVDRVDQYKMDVFLTNRTTNLMIYLKSVDCTLLEQHIVRNEAINLQIKHDLSTHHIFDSGLYLVFASLQHTLLPPSISFISPFPQLLLKTTNTEFGFINKLFKNHPSITFEEAMYHNQFLQQLQIHQQKSNWNVKLVYMDIYLPNRQAKEEWISYKFKQLTVKKITNQNSIVRKEIKPDHIGIRDYSLHIKIHQNFKDVKFVFVTPNQASRNEGNINAIRNLSRPHENQIPEKYFKNTWRQYIKKRNESELLKNQYLDIDQLLKATHYILNHLEFNRYIKGKASIFRNQEMVQLMDQ